MESKRLYRSNIDRKFAGVAGGLGEYFNIDPLLFRLIFVVLVFAGGSGIMIYIVMWIVTPESPVYIHQPVNQANNGYPQNSSNPSDNTAEPRAPESATCNATPAPQTKERKQGSLIGGLVLITLGALFLADELIPQISFGDIWPLLLVAIGVGLLINAVTSRNKNMNNQELKK